ncbi:MAG: hypothetical protein ACKVU2_08850, partial [Saprospiraceae bacterium]
MQQFTFPLTFSPETTARLRREQNALDQALEQRGHLSAPQLASLRAALDEAIAQLADDPDFLPRLLADIRPNLLHLTGLEADGLLNLPWHLVAKDSTNLFISKGLPLRTTTTSEGFETLPTFRPTLPTFGSLPTFDPHLPLPLKILIMIAAPDHSGGAARLDHEAEEKIILDALSELIRTGEVEVEFIDGDLPSLRRALSENKFHVLYFCGHSAFVSSVGVT